jgi:hypothetical protein
MANKARGEITLELGGESYVLRPEFGVIAEIEDELDSNMFKLGARVERLDFNAKELVRTVQAVLKANGHEVAEDRLAEAIAKAGAGPVLVPLIAFIGSYVWGGRSEKKANGAAGMEETAAGPDETGTGEETSSASS